MITKSRYDVALAAQRAAPWMSDGKALTGDSVSTYCDQFPTSNKLATGQELTGLPPVLMTAGTYDFATPFWNSVVTADAINGYLLIVAQNSHGTYLMTPCATEITNHFYKYGAAKFEADFRAGVFKQDRFTGPKGVFTKDYKSRSILGPTCQLISFRSPSGAVGPSSLQSPWAYVVRHSGATRVDTSIGAATSGVFTGAKNAILADGRGFADAVAAGPLARALSAPLLLTVSPALESSVISSLRSQGITSVTIVGGTGAVSAHKAQALTNAGFTVTRIAGSDRFATAKEIAIATEKLTGVVNRIFIADGMNFPDALAAGVAAANARSVLVLSKGSALESATRGYLATHSRPLTAAGGPAATAVRNAGYSSAHAVVGSDRYGTAAQLATAYGAGATSAVIATGMNFADATSGGALAARSGGVLLLTPPTTLAPVTRSTLLSLPIGTVRIMGGTGAVSSSVENALRSLS